MDSADRDLFLTEKKKDCLFSDPRLSLYRTFYETADHEELGPYYSLKLRSYAVVVALDGDGRYICVRQFRHGIGRITTEFPAGGIAALPGEESISAEAALRGAKRELLEETGCTSGHWTHLFTACANSTLADNKAFLFLATGCRRTAAPQPDHTERLETVRLAPSELEARIRQGDFPHPVHILAWYLARERQAAAADKP